MKGFLLDSVSAEVSDVKSNKIKEVDSQGHISFRDGRKYKTAVAKIEFTSTGDVSDVDSQDLADKLSELLRKVNLDS